MIHFGDLMRQVAPLLGYDPGEANHKGIARYRSRGSLRIDFHKGLFADYEAGEAGGVLDLVRYTTGDDPREWLERNGLNMPAPAARPRRRTTEDHGAERRDATDEERERIEVARNLWKEGEAVDVRCVTDYFASRCLKLGDTSQLRFHPKTPWRPPGEALQYRPCLLVAYRNLDDDQMTGLSRILLDEPECWPKTQRMMLGVVRRAAAKLVPVKHVLAVAEGVETAIAANMMGYGPAWALGSAGAVANFPMLPGIERLILLQENNFASRDAVARCGRRWMRAGRKVTRVRPDDGCDDLNDELIAKGIA